MDVTLFLNQVEKYIKNHLVHQLYTNLKTHNVLHKILLTEKNKK